MKTKKLNTVRRNSFGNLIIIMKTENLYLNIHRRNNLEFLLLLRKQKI